MEVEAAPPPGGRGGPGRWGRPGSPCSPCLLEFVGVHRGVHETRRNNRGQAERGLG